MGAAFDESFKKRYRRNKEALEWYDALAMAVAVIAIVFTFFVRIVKVDGHSMDPTLSNGERILINLMKQPDYGDIVVHVFRKDMREFYNLERLWRDGEEVDISAYLT